ncbi:hypothetical protein [Brachybacterium sp. AOP3-A1-3]|uniref:hypothetical protein n=1 Tax=Brachybacterium sp. AOP3-A1-3 TaxID=3457699 RepID=UPI004033C376
MTRSTRPPHRIEGLLTVETLYHSGPILTMVDQDDAPEAVIVRDGRIAVVGALDDARA